MPAVAAMAGCVVMASCVAGGADTTTAWDAIDAALPLSVAAKLSVMVPDVPVNTRLVNVTTPLASELTGTVPPSVPPPVAIVAVTGIPLVAEFAPLASLS